MKLPPLTKKKNTKLVCDDKLIDYHEPLYKQILQQEFKFMLFSLGK